MSYEFRVGQKVVCIKPFLDRPFYGETYPVPREIYTVREIYRGKNLCLRLAEIVNGTFLYEGGKMECAFVARSFRPLVTDTQKWLREVLETPPSTTKRHEVERLS